MVLIDCLRHNSGCGDSGGACRPTGLELRSCSAEFVGTHDVRYCTLRTHINRNCGLMIHSVA